MIWSKENTIIDETRGKIVMCIAGLVLFIFISYLISVLIAYIVLEDDRAFVWPLVVLKKLIATIERVFD